MQPVDDGTRRAELSASLGAVRRRLADAAAAAGRPVSAITLIAVTKTYPAADAAALADLGVADLGESKDQEAKAKAGEVAGLTSAPVRWHLVGRLQTNKAKSVAGYATAVHSVDRLELVAALARGCERVERTHPLEVFVQLSLDGDPTRGGVVEADLPAVAEAVAAAPVLRLRGVMAVPPLGADPAAAFARLPDLAARVRAAHPEADAISAG
ncbi:MAG: alanine racemase, partial [Jatrophihabitans sp.]|uniref:alanine racemase n=1 Tax=Jatrophihabitans sp. TaxID=1932789 RepID=UPI003F80B9C9